MNHDPAAGAGANFVRVPAHHDCRQPRLQAAQLEQQVPAVIMAEVDVEQDGIDRALLEMGERFLAGGGDEDIEIIEAQRLGERGADAGIVIDDQHLYALSHATIAGSVPARQENNIARIVKSALSPAAKAKAACGPSLFS